MIAIAFARLSVTRLVPLVVFEQLLDRDRTIQTDVMSFQHAAEPPARELALNHLSRSVSLLFDRDLALVEAEGNPIMLLGTAFAFVHLLDYCGERGLSFTLIAVLIHGPLVFGPELFAQVLRTPPPDEQERGDRDHYYNNR